MSDARLCYIEDAFAYFTTQPVVDQTGDDWNDTPYEHNAGRPYEWREGMKHRGVPVKPYVIVKVAFETDLYTPAQRSGSINSPWCIDDINGGKTPWLASNDSSSQDAIWAGETLADFIRKVRAHEGRVYVDIEQVRGWSVAA